MITINFQTNSIKIKKRVLVAVKRFKNKIVYSSGLVYFKSEDESKEFESRLKVRGFEVIEVDINNSHPPDQIRSIGLYCPYCRQQEVWKKNNIGSNCCPICGMSDSDFYVRKYNRLEKK